MAATEKVCLNHPGRPATTRCETCFKPLCDECVIEEGGKHFCSETCAQNYVATGERIEELEASKRRIARRKLIKRLVTLIILIVIAAAAYFWMKSNPDKTKDMMKTLEKKTSEVKSKVSE